MADQTPILPTSTTPKRTTAGASMGRNSAVYPYEYMSPSIRAASNAASRSRRISASGYFFTLAFLACVVVLVSNASGLSAHDMLRTTTAYSTLYRSHFSSVMSRLFPGSGTTAQNGTFQKPEAAANDNVSTIFQELKMEGLEEVAKSGNSSQASGRKIRASSGHYNPPLLLPPPVESDNIRNSESSGRSAKAERSYRDSTGPINGRSRNSASVDKRRKGESQGRKKKSKGKKRKQKLNNSTSLRCDLFDGKWVKDDTYPLYEAGSCPHIDEPFDCRGNGRPDREYEKYRWQPKNCNIPRLSGKDMLQMMRGKRFVFVGDSLNRNMWESLVCVLRNSVKDKSKVYEVSGREEFRSEGSYSFIFEDYNSSVEFFRSPFLVQEWEMPDTNGKKKDTLRLDLIEALSDRFKTADVLVFNTGHWWTHEKTSEGKAYYQEGSHVYEQLDVNEAFQRAMTTWARWMDANINPWRTTVVFRSYSASHFIGGEWNSGGQCDAEAEPIKSEKHLSEYPPIPLVHVLEATLKTMKTPVFYLNITRLSDYRKEAHPSVHRKPNMTQEEKNSAYQDCSHWCLPGVPDTWNELVYAKLLMQQRWRHKGRPEIQLADLRKLQ